MAEQAQKDISIGGVLVLAFVALAAVGWVNGKLHPERVAAEAAAEAKAQAAQQAATDARHAREDAEAKAKQAKEKADAALLQVEQNAWDVLADPIHAKFTNVVEVQVAEGVVAYCGDVTALNTLGGRTTERFVAWWSGARIESQGSKFQSAHQVLCEGKPVVRSVPGFAWGGDPP